MDVAALFVTLASAVALYPIVGAAIVEQVELAGPFVNLLAFVAILTAGQLLYTLGASVVRGLLVGVFFALPPLRALDAIAGLAPGFVKGALLIAVVAAAFKALPMAAELKRVFDTSVVVQRTAPIAAAVAPDLPALLGRLGLESIVVAPPPQSPTTPHSRSVQFPPNLAADVDPQAEIQMLDLLNRERSLNGLGPLLMDDRLREAARGHSLEMFHLSYFAHESPAAGSPFDRMQRAGARFQAAGENLAYAPGVETAHRGLMNSPEHRKNILGPQFRRVGIGVARANSWGRMFTQNFSD